MTKSVDDEQVSQSEFSCGPIEDREDIIRIIVYPHHVERGEIQLKTAAFQRTELTDRGASIERKAFTDPAKLTHSSHKLLTKENRSIAGYAMVECSSVRAIVDDMGDRTFCVLDTALKCNPAHGDIFFAKELPKPKQIKYRKDMIDAFNKSLISHCSLYAVEEIFPP